MYKNGFRTTNYSILLSRPRALRQEHTGQTVGQLKHSGRLGRGREQICLVCSAALEAFGTTSTLSALIQHAQAEVGCCPLDSLIGCVLAV